MSLTQLRTTLEAYRSGHGGTLVLDSKTIREQSILGLIGYLTGTKTQSATLTLHSVPKIAAPSGGGLTVTGTTSLPGVHHKEVTIEFRMVRSHVAVTMTTELDTSWKIASIGLMPAYRVAPRGPDITKLSGWKHGVLVFSNHKFHDSTRGVTFLAGVNLYGEVQLSTLDLDLDWLGSIDDLTAVSGRIGLALHGGGPRIAYVHLETKPLPSRFKLGEISLESLILSLDSVWSQDSAKTTEISHFCSVDGHFEIDRHPVEITVLVNQTKSPTLDFTAEVDLKALELLKVTKTLGLPDLSHTLPAPLKKIAGGVELQTVQLGYAPRAATKEKISYVGLSIGTTTPWTLVDDWLKIDRITVSWKVFEPFAGRRRQFHSVISGDLTLAGTKWQIQSTLPDFNVSAWLLTGGHGLDLGHWFEHQFGIQLPPVVSDVDVSSLAVSYQSAAKVFELTSAWRFGKSARTTLTLAHYAAGSPKATFDGLLTFNFGQADQVDFEVSFEGGGGGPDFLVGVYDHPGGVKLSVPKLISALTGKKPPAPLTGLKIGLENAIFAHQTAAGANKAKSIFGLEIAAGINLSALGHLPVIGHVLAAAKTLQIGFQIVYPVLSRGDKFTLAELSTLNGMITAPGPRFPDRRELKNIAFNTTLRFGAEAPIDLKLPVGLNRRSGKVVSRPARGSGGAFRPAGSQATDDGVHWFALGKSFGPLHLQRIGFAFKSPHLTVALDGGVGAFGLEIDLLGLSVSTKVVNVDDFDPHFALHGLGLELNKGSLEIGGALLKLDDEYDGLAVLGFEELRLAVIGSLATFHGAPSLFLYGVLDTPLGGPPFLFITGLAAGFGYNRQLKPPPVQQIRTFPLVAEAMGPPPSMPREASKSGRFLEQEMRKLHEFIVPRTGEYFVCVGVRFSTFEIVDTFVLLNVSFGQEFEIDVLGLCRVVAPPLENSVPALLQATLELRGVFNPSEGLLMVQGQLTRDSYVLDPGCHLTGGFAVGSWFGSNQYAGDFVATVGGYNKHFTKPSHYPTVPRLGVVWKVSTELNVTGGLYFALTPHAMMAGGSLHAVFQTDVDLSLASASVKAWFLIGADFLVYWKPFSYHMDLYVDFGVHATIHFFGSHHVHFDVGADLSLWGPPFGGHAHAHLKVVGVKLHFNVDFGAGPRPPKPLVWNKSDDKAGSFRPSFLPKDEQIVTVAVRDGLQRTVEDAQRNTWHVVNPKELVVATGSAIPIKHLHSKIPLAHGRHLHDHELSFGIAPMRQGSSQVKTWHQIHVEGLSHPERHFLLTPIAKNVPAAVWAAEHDSDVNAPRLVKNAVCGFSLAPAVLFKAGHTRPIDRDKLEYTIHPLAKAYEWQEVEAFHVKQKGGTTPSGNAKLWRKIQGEIVHHAGHNARRTEMLDALGFRGSVQSFGRPFSEDAAFAPQYGALSG